MTILNAYIEYDPETNLYIGLIPNVPGAHTQAASLDELHENLKEVAQLCLEENSTLLPLPKFIGIQQIEVA
ncbi:MAG: type II toxin-antitoxin system HicB family antitoxin [Vampirovibrionales bacterium]|nr:type II toxin-antitoxin system HicB family antitoxin [Vampirovibrionales bacterium]